jgi:hypothetical protein
VTQALLCIFCGNPGHFISDCLVCQYYIANGKCKKNTEGKVVLPSGQYCPHSMPGWFIKEQINDWHKRNLSPSKLDSKTSASSTSSLMMYEILLIMTINSSDFAATNMVSTPLANVFTADQCITALEQEIFTLQSTKKKNFVRGHPSISLLPLSSPTLLFICIHPPHLCTTLKDHIHSRQFLGLTVRRLPRSRLINSCRLPASPSARTSTALDGLRLHWDRSA